MDQSNSDVLYSDNLNDLRLEIVRLRSLLLCESRVTSTYRVRCEHLGSLISLLINHEYGKS